MPMECRVQNFKTLVNWEIRYGQIRFRNLSLRFVYEGFGIPCHIQLCKGGVCGRLKNIWEILRYLLILLIINIHYAETFSCTWIYKSYITPHNNTIQFHMHDNSVSYALVNKLELAFNPYPHSATFMRQRTNFSVIRTEYKAFHSWKCIWKCRLPNWRAFCPRGAS